MTNSSTSAFSVNEVLNASWDITKKHWSEYLILFLAAAVVYAVYAIVYHVLNIVLDLPHILNTVLSFFVRIYVALFVVKGTLALVRDQKFDINDVVKLSGKNYLHALLAGILFAIIVGIGFILLIIPGVIAAIMFGFYLYSIVDKDTEGVQALEDSMHMTNGNKMSIFLYDFILFFLGAGVVGIPGFVCLMLFFGAGGLHGLHVGPALVIAIFGLAAVIVLTIGLSMYSMSGMGYMYTKMRAKTPLKLSK